MNSGKPRGKNLHSGDGFPLSSSLVCSLKEVTLCPDLGCFFPLLSFSAASALVADPVGARQSLPAHLEHIARVVLVSAKPVNKPVLKAVLQNKYFRNLKGVANVLSECF